MTQNHNNNNTNTSQTISLGDKINKQIQYIESQGFIISDTEKVTWYLKQVGIYRLSRYFSVFKSEIANEETIDFQRVIDCYVFDKQLRTHCMSLLEITEVYLKNLLILIIDYNYEDKSFYVSKFSQKRLEFITDKIKEICEKDTNIDKIFQKNWQLSARIFFNNISFGEARKIFEDLRLVHKKKIAKEFGIHFSVLENWLEWMVHLRNLCSHTENVFNRTMKHTLVGDFFDESFGIENDNKFISYLIILQVFNKIIIPNYKWEEYVLDLISKYTIDTEKFANIKIASLFELSPIKIGSSAWEAFVHIIYTEYVKK